MLAPARDPAAHRRPCVPTSPARSSPHWCGAHGSTGAVLTMTSCTWSMTSCRGHRLLAGLALAAVCRRSRTVTVAGGELVGADDHARSRAPDAVGGLHLAFMRAAVVRPVGADARPRAARAVSASASRAAGRVDDEHVDRRRPARRTRPRRRRRAAMRSMPSAEPDAGRRRTAELPRPGRRSDRRRRSRSARSRARRLELERGARVVVEAAHEPRRRSRTGCRAASSPACTRVEVRGGLVATGSRAMRGAAAITGCVLRPLRVEHPQRVALPASARLCSRQRVGVRGRSRRAAPST